MHMIFIILLVIIVGLHIAFEIGSNGGTGRKDKFANTGVSRNIGLNVSGVSRIC